MALILVAEDEFLLADMLSDFLRDAEHEVVLAPHGIAALKALAQRRPDLLISDYMMPLMNGAELATAVRQDEHLAGLPILLLSGAQAHLARARPDLFDAVIEKPYVPERLMQIVTALLAREGA